MGNIWPFIGRQEELQDFREALTDSTVRTYLITGAQGTGKTRLSEECLNSAQAAGYRTWQAVTSSEIKIELGALAHVLPGDFDLRRPLESFQAFVKRIGASGKEGRIVIQVDNVNLLDEASVTVLEQIMKARLGFVVATLDEDASVPNSVANWVYSDSTRRVELSYFSREEVETVLAAALKGVLPPRTVDYFFNVSRGNILYLRELVFSALKTGQLEFNGDVWEVAGILKPSPRLSDLVKKRVDSLEPNLRRLLDTISLCGPSSVGDFSEEISRLESLGLVKVARQERRTMAEVSHPMYAEVLKSQLSESERSAIFSAQADRIRAIGARRQRDILDIAQWELAAKRSVDSMTLLKGSRAARREYDYEHVKALSEAACRADDGFIPRLLLGEALYELGKPEEAIENLKIAANRAEDEEHIILATLALTRTYCWGLAEPEEAIKIGKEVAERVRTPEAKEALKIARGICLTHMERITEARELLENVDKIPNAHIRGMGQATQSTVLALCGRAEEALVIARRAYEERLHFLDAPVLPNPAINTSPIALALQESGALDQAYMSLLRGWDEGNSENDPECLTLMSAGLARAALLEGRPHTARRWASQSVALARRYRFDGPLYPALHRLAEASALLRDKSSAQRALSEVNRRNPRPWGSFTPELCLGEVWLSVASGKLSDARGQLVEAGNVARDIGHLCAEARLMTDLARLGDSKQAVQRLEWLAQASSAKFTKIRYEFALALIRQDPEKLMTSAANFQKAGALLLSAEAAASASRVWQRKGKSRDSMASLRIMKSVWEHCEGAWTPLIASVGPATPLTVREMEIALRVAEGHTNAEVAERLFLSKRTVDNHLLSIYRKLGVKNRKELNRALVGDY